MTSMNTNKKLKELPFLKKVSTKYKIDQQSRN
eukprot:CAMPEP_0170562546 /NCGR_PEP_ID=MMETSP0211-20121228/61099_1 /TAXON_ID=311385 /ORGANISM="Pseudokeronopsis sp., Strain OXSARD2" /LENGTH=31 /DNA_ID= /DNA_START= /DNA_END= /DNA_ORIENTATION=